ncbi:MAG TPA: T9SS type A sorting domain-containing protein [Bacteroidia bacterium]|jgi:photosystem II stability/assembly factor-like uncharacterized protein|nr:T9SS type A sorting domain-containing protein [Bacteroidia bacterium]
MKNKSHLIRSSISLPSILIGAAMVSGLFLYHQSQIRQYSPGIKAETEESSDAMGMAQFFFNARKNIITNALDYVSMMATEDAIRKANASKKLTSNMGLTWTNMGPNNIGGRTRAILVYNQDNTGNTLFAGGVSGGLWKSTDAGQTWNMINDNFSNMNVTCITQDNTGVIYFGTGEGFVTGGGTQFSEGALGGGVFKSTDGGNTFTVLTNTVPTPSNNAGAAWAYVNRIAVQPNNSSVVYAATNGGVFESTDGGNTWTKLITGTNCFDLKIANDASIIVACASGTGYYGYPNSAGAVTFTKMKASGNGKLPASYRIEFGISPTNPNRIYASVVNSNSLGELVGEYMTKTAVSSGNGGYWYCIAPGGSTAFDPYGVGGQYQGYYDNCIAVDPTNEGRAVYGGTTLYEWKETSSSDTLGGWTSLTTYYGYPYSPTSVHPDTHTLVYDPYHSNVLYLGCDGGIYKSVNSGFDWAAVNRNYDVTQYYAVTFGPYPPSNDIGGAGGGTQDNGSPYISGPYSADPNIGDALDLGGGDGGQASISYINPNAYFVSTDGDQLLRGSNLSGLGSPGNAYDSLIGAIRTDAAIGAAVCFVQPLALYENSYDLNTADSIWYYSDSTFKAGDTIYPHTPNGGLTYPYILGSIEKDTFKVQNRVQSRMATGFNGAAYVWINMRAIDFSDAIIWIPIAGTLNGFTDGNPVHCMAWSPDGDALFVGTEGGNVYRFSNLNAITDTSNGAVFSIHGGKFIANPKCIVQVTKLASPGRDVLSICVDQNNPNYIIYTLGNYGSTTYVYEITNALSAGPFTPKALQGSGLPSMPVYGSVFGLVNSSYPNGAILATEHGIYSTPDATVASPTWSTDDNGMASNVLSFAIGQQTAPQWMCSNSGKIYLGTHGRGIWVCDNFFVAPTAVPQISNSEGSSMKVYPNPMNVQGTIEYSLTKADKISVDVYDIQGKLVKSIPASNSTIGTHTVTFSVTDMPAGTYIATLTGSDFRKSARFIVER